MPIYVQHIGAMLLGARADQQVRERNAVLATLGELALGRLGCGQRRRIDAQIPVCIEVLAQRREILQGGPDRPWDAIGTCMRALILCERFRGLPPGEPQRGRFSRWRRRCRASSERQ
ncbi:MAG: hypothetical protein QOJ89_442 [bacterium]